MIEFKSIRTRVVVPNRFAIPSKLSPGLTLYFFTGEGFGEADGVGDAVGLGVAEADGLGVGVGAIVGVGVGLTGAGVTVGAGAAETLSLTTCVPEPTFDPVGTRFAKTESTGIALGPVPLSATYRALFAIGRFLPSSIRKYWLDEVRINLEPAASEIDKAAQVPGSSSREVVGYCVKVASLTRTSFPATTR